MCARLEGWVELGAWRGPDSGSNTSREARKECCVGRAWAEGWMLAGNPEQGLALVRCPERQAGRLPPPWRLLVSPAWIS